MITSPLSSNVRHKEMLTPQWRFSGGAWVGHGSSQIFGWPPVCCLISRSSSFDGDIQQITFSQQNFKWFEDCLATALTIFTSLCWDW